LTLFICGNSHVGAIKRGFDKLDAKLATPAVLFPLGSARFERTPFSVLEGNTVRVVQADYVANLRKFAGSEVFGAEHLWGFCIGTHTARIYAERFWLNAAPSEVCPPRQRPVSRAQLAAIIAGELRQVLAFFARLQQAQVPFFVVSGPPPRPDHPFIARGASRKAVLHIDREVRRYFLERLAEARIDFVSPPQEASDTDGFLRSDYCAGLKPGGRFDPHHANTAYGMLMAQRVIDHVTQRVP
jgi:hypothetical protein